MPQFDGDRRPFDGDRRRFDGETAVRNRHALTVGTRLGGLALLGVLGVSVLSVASGGPSWLTGRYVTAAMVLLGAAAIVGRFVAVSRRGFASDLEPYLFAVQAVLSGLLLVVLYRSFSPGYGLAESRRVSTLVIWLLLVAVCVTARDPRRYRPVQWLALGCLATVTGIFFYHGLAGTTRVPFWFGAVMVVGIAVVPQYLSRTTFLWAANRYAAVVILLALPAYVLGEYTLFGLSFGFMRSYTIPVVDYEVRAARSLYVNRNAFAVAAFGGFLAAVGEFHRAATSDRPVWTVVVPAALFGINALGLAISFGRVLWVVTPMAVGVYLAYLAWGRRAVPLAVVAGFAYLVVGIAAVHTGLAPIGEDTPTRAERWYPAVAAILDDPSLLGEGFVNTTAYIAPYIETAKPFFVENYTASEAPGSPHNAYLRTTIRAGLLGGLAYLTLVVSSLVSGAQEVRRRHGDATVAVILLALGVGFAAHQQFEAYSLYNYGSSTVLAVFVTGFLLFGDRD
jgi:hypothetical protein